MTKENQASRTELLAKLVQIWNESETQSEFYDDMARLIQIDLANELQEAGLTLRTKW